MIEHCMDKLAGEIHQIARKKGFWDHARIDRLSMIPAVEHSVPNPSIDGEKMALMHSEISEALEANRDGDKELEEEELADTIIRILDYAHYKGYSMDVAVRRKINKNRERERLHGRQW